MSPAGSHEIDRLHGAQGLPRIVAPSTTGDANALDRQEYRKGLAGLLVPACPAQFLDEDVIGQSQRLSRLGGNLAEDAHAEAGPRKRVAVQHGCGEPELDANAAHLVLEQLAQRFDQLELHALRQAADVVMALDHVRLARAGAGRLDDVRINRALGEKIDAADLRGLGLEDLYEQAADELALGLRVSNSTQRREVAFAGIDPDHLDAQGFRKHVPHGISFAEPQEAVINEHARQLRP